MKTKSEELNEQLVKNKIKKHIQTRKSVLQRLEDYDKSNSKT